MMHRFFFNLPGVAALALAWRLRARQRRHRPRRREFQHRPAMAGWAISTWVMATVWGNDVAIVDGQTNLVTDIVPDVLAHQD